MQALNLIRYIHENLIHFLHAVQIFVVTWIRIISCWIFRFHCFWKSFPLLERSMCNQTLIQLLTNLAGPLGCASSYTPLRNTSQPNPTWRDERISFGSFLIFLLLHLQSVSCLEYSLTSWCHLLTREEPWKQNSVKDMECLWSLARLLAKEKTDMNTLARCSVFYKQCKLSISSATYMRIWFVSYLLGWFMLRISSNTKRITPSSFGLRTQLRCLHPKVTTNTNEAEEPANKNQKDNKSFSMKSPSW